MRGSLRDHLEGVGSYATGFIRNVFATNREVINFSAIAANDEITGRNLNNIIRTTMGGFTKIAQLSIKSEKECKICRRMSKNEGF